MAYTVTYKDLLGNTQRAGTYGAAPLWTPITKTTSNNGKSSAPKKNTSSSEPYTFRDYGDYSAYSSGSYSGGGGYTPIKSDISGLLAAYDQQANSARDTAQRSYENTRSDLLTSLKRFQEQNARDQKFQRQQYLEGQASLESAREQANRQNRISSAARGLSGSGLQQLAQLQNLIGQGEQVSQLANENQEAMDNLRNLLMQQEEDHNTQMARNEKTLADTLNNIASNLASQKAQAIAENEAAYANAVNQARASAAASRASSAAADAQIGVGINDLLSTTSVSLRKLSNSSKANTVKLYAANAGLDFSDRDLSSTKKIENAKKEIAYQIQRNFDDQIASWGVGGNTKGSLARDLDAMSKKYGFYGYYNK